MLPDAILALFLAAFSTSSGHAYGATVAFLSPATGLRDDVRTAQERTAAAVEARLGLMQVSENTCGTVDCDSKAICRDQHVSYVLWVSAATLVPIEKPSRRMQPEIAITLLNCQDDSLLAARKSAEVLVTRLDDPAINRTYRNIEREIVNQISASVSRNSCEKTPGAFPANRSREGLARVRFESTRGVQMRSCASSIVAREAHDKSATRRDRGDAIDPSRASACRARLPAAIRRLRT